MEKLPDIKAFRFKDTSFASLMTKRIFNVLLIATKYDSFTLEDDGRIDEQIFNEYTSLNLNYPPRFTQVVTEEEALAELSENHYELIIQMPNMDEADMFATSKRVKELYPDTPFVVLTAFSREVTKRLSQEDLSGVDYVFSWLGNPDLLLAIIKLIEDAMNVEHDTESVGVQVILLIEDSVRFYSSALPTLFKIVMEESKEFSKEALNEHQQMLRMRGRPKIMLARTYEEAVEIYAKYYNNMLGIVTDMSYAHEGVKDKLAGYEFAKMMRNKKRFVPIVFTSSEIANKAYAEELGCSFIDKNSKSFPRDLRKQVVNNFGFGDFIIINPETGEEIQRIRNLKDLQKSIFTIPTESLVYHLSNDHFSRFFYSRAMFPMAEWLKKIKVSDYSSMDEARQLIYDMIIKYRKVKNSGVVAIFDKDRFDEFSNFARMGDGSIGGKGRSIAFMDNIVKEHLELNEDDNIPVIIPRTVVLCTDIFDEFMETNDLYPIALSDKPDDEILRYFLKAGLPDRLIEDFMVFLETIKAPIAVRSSSLLEDSHYQPFAGVYSTYMIPMLEDRYETLGLLSKAIKAVYASVFYKDSKTYMAATQNLIDQEKMAIVLQEAVGTQYGDHFYPTISGVARSLNFYPVGNEEPEEGIANIVLGLGKYIVEGGVNLRFSPAHPHNIVQLSSVELALRDTQRYFYALDMKNVHKEFSTNDGFNLLKLSIKDAEKDDSIRYISSTYDPVDQVIYDGYYDSGRKIISFANVLQHNVFPLAEILQQVLKIGQQEMGRAVEIEFAADLKDKGEGNFYLLQIRPIVQNKELVVEDLSEIRPEVEILHSVNALGHGVMNDIYDIVYVKTKDFNAAKNMDIAVEIDKINTEFLNQEKNYILVGPGRWGSSDSWLGIPVRWPQISNAQVLVEIALDNYKIEPSQGTHFFQNLTSFGVGYFSINPSVSGDGLFDEDYLNRQPAVFETEYIRHVHFQKPMMVKINGKKKMGTVLKSEQ
ncbi:CheY-like chemotaxis protein [Dysgonomonas sp. PFB1-18]|uniref:PEP/pyruvate-binding domain-containing protein n=1 Tax=unclassified Dysgonomonas TaxID=2630389 RepID=UPI002473AAEA|nr:MULTISPECIES: PEP/pyruvate-binding domain-containing protein [unclassified Dysgonomonas]MDH6308823.1 CheY-like chemotaxis protein [Dysgonomonas sp. PF1-14]MDH6338481.1 CheY-like chemotaxis protein [Dysgonomonas sp. PF1-16]MDH6380072.1 CheY-like chemotaxis protein [Dysgonomonas sp. PFB1-18]MDH6397309.1 CheY-like chemotaxis protein [Dysgonomonas sp. PF1-23]